jgi:hypothetical protein
MVSAEKQSLVYRIPECVKHFVDALVDPFGAPAGACLPADLYPLPSSKVKTFIRARMALGTSGIGFAHCVPSPGNDNGQLFTTTSASVGTTATLFSAFTNVNTLTCAQLPYTYAQTNTSGLYMWRLVAAGMRIKYVGQLMTRNGMVIAYEDPDHQEVRAKSFDTLGSNPQTSLKRVGDENWDSSVCWSGPVTPEELEFVNKVYGPVALGTSPMILAVSGVAGDIYEVEYFQHIELIGTVVVNKTPSHAEAQLFGKAVEAAKSLTSVKPLQQTDKRTLWQKVTQGIKESLPALVQMGKGTAEMLMGAESSGLLDLAQGAQKFLMEPTPRSAGRGIYSEPKRISYKGSTYTVEEPE